MMDHAQANIFIAGQRLNDLTGYSGIEALKRKIESQEQTVQSNRATVHEARAAYAAAISTRASSQREVNQLLQRKQAWSPEDLERFTSLYRSDHANEQAETTARERLSKIENESEEAAARLNATILARYHEEQIWSDKIRRMSTWGTWGLMGVNVLLFFIFQVGVEPWRRARLVKGFEEKVHEALEREAAANAVERELEQRTLSGTNEDLQAGRPQDVVVAAAGDPGGDGEPENLLQSSVLSASDSTLSPEGNISAPKAQVPAVLKEMFSEQLVTVRRVDITTAMLEGAAAGVVFLGAIVLFLRPR